MHKMLFIAGVAITKQKLEILQNKIGVFFFFPLVLFKKTKLLLSVVTIIFVSFLHVQTLKIIHER